MATQYNIGTDNHFVGFTLDELALLACGLYEEAANEAQYTDDPRTNVAKWAVEKLAIIEALIEKTEEYRRWIQRDQKEDEIE